MGLSRLMLLLPLLLLVFTGAGPYARAEEEHPSSARVLLSREESRLARLRMIRDETKEIRLATYHFFLDDIGKDTLGMIVDARKRGVKVKIILDGMPVGLPKERAMMKALKDMGVEIKIYNPLFRYPHRATFRNHMKSLIGSRALISGDRNVANPYFARRKSDKHLSIDMELEDPRALRDATEHFDEFFQSTKMVSDPIGLVSDAEVESARLELEAWSRSALERFRPMRSLRKYSISNLRYVADVADPAVHSVSGMNQDIFAMIRRAKSSLVIMNPYISLTPELKKELTDAVARGVKIKIISNSSNVNNAKVMRFDWKETAPELVGMGIEVHEVDREAMLHAKTIVRDGVEVYVGSYNWDPRSQRLNVENGVIFDSEEISRVLNNYATRIRIFTNPVDLVDPATLTPAQKAARCFRSNVRRLILAPIRPHI